MDLNELNTQAVELLRQLIATPSFSREEDQAAGIIENFLLEKNIAAQRHLNNVWAVNKYFDGSKPTILLNSHHDTVKPNKGYTLDPFQPVEKDGKLFGLGSNDAGGPLVSLVSAFVFFYGQQNLKYNLVLAATAEEEISGKNGIEALLPLLPEIDCGIVGEPTILQLAVAERGLMVLDCVALGKAGHAAREEGDNALYKAVRDIEWFRDFQFERSSQLLGPVKMTVTSIETENEAHNVVPSECKFVVDIRLNELYTHEEVLTEIEKNIQSRLTMRSDRLKSSMIPLDHPLVKAGMQLGKAHYGSPTSSDKALMPFPALKAGPGDSARSHTADEFIYLNEIRDGIDFYINLLKQMLY
jgi:acetylornithine deacetylase